MGLSRAEYQEQLRHQDPLFKNLNELGVRILDPTEWLVGPTGLCRMTKDGNALYFDTAHLTIPGAILLRPCFEPLFAAPMQGASSGRTETPL